MTDRTELKRTAEGAIQEHDEWVEAGENWPQWNRRYLAFKAEATPEVVLALLAESEQLKHDVAAGSAREWDLRSQVRSAKESRARVVQSNKAAREERDQLKAEIEALRKKVGRARVVAIPSKADPKYWESFPELEGGPDFNGCRYVSDLLTALKADNITVSEVAP